MLFAAGGGNQGRDRAERAHHWTETDLRRARAAQGCAPVATGSATQHWHGRDSWGTGRSADVRTARSADVLPSERPAAVPTGRRSCRRSCRGRRSCSRSCRTGRAPARVHERAIRACDGPTGSYAPDDDASRRVPDATGRRADGNGSVRPAANAADANARAADGAAAAAAAQCSAEPPAPAAARPAGFVRGRWRATDAAAASGSGRRPARWAAGRRSATANVAATAAV
mmetsp:Transcript_3740/g.8236  ORF Transcript_3740/g.8236 Transcript_3740/m.8236 type:complete len:228 (+) Transcript_3740:1790-2473(+)